MNDTTINNITVAVNGPLTENQYMKELLAILKDNGKDPSGLDALISHVADMENFVRQSEKRIAEMKAQLDGMKEVQDHPVKNTLQKTIRALESRIADIKEHIVQLRLDIAQGCRDAISAFKEKGVAALDKLASFFNIKGGLQSMVKNIDASIKLDDHALAKIEAFSKQYHTAGNALRNMGRVLTGKQPVDAVKESGRLAKVFSAPYMADRAGLLGMKKVANKMLSAIEMLEQRAAAARDVRADKASDKKPSLSEKLKANKELIRQKDLEKPIPERARTPELEV